MTVYAHWSPRFSGFHGLPVNALQVGPGDFGMALSAGSRNIPVIDFGFRILRRKNVMASMAIRTGRRSVIPIQNRAPMHALAIEFDRAGEWDLMPRKELGIAVTGGAGFRQIFFGYRRNRFAGSLNLMRRSVTGDAVWGIRVASCRRLSVHAVAK